jgi:hypothetical protein
MSAWLLRDTIMQQVTGITFFACLLVTLKILGFVSDGHYVGHREELQVGDEVQVLPCNSAHVFHPPCLAPWLAAHNSCPVCRFELKTDDDQYERRKEREQAEAEDRKGAENAISHNEFMYI